MFKRLKDPKFIAVALSITVIFTIASWGLSRRVIAVSSSTYENLKIFSDVIGVIQDNYTESVDVKELIYNAIKGMVKGLDPHSSFLTPDEYSEMQIETKGSFGGIGIEIGMRDNMLTVVAPIEDTPAFKAGILAGDRIVKIGEKHTKDLTLNEAVNLMRGPKDTPVTIYIMRDGFQSPKAFTLIRATIKVKSVKFRPLEDGYGYVRIVQFQENTTEELGAALKELKGKNGTLNGLVLDMRNNPGGLLDEAVSVSNEFLDSGIIVYTKGRVQGKDVKFTADTARMQPDFPIIVLVNGGSASASEIVAGALQDHKRAIILGTTSFGKASVQTIISLADGSAVRLTTAKYYTPSGRSIQAKGIEPDIVVGEVVKEHLKEKDLERHLLPEDGPPENNEGNASGRTRIIEAVSKGEEGEDVQLKRALEYLKSWHIFLERSTKAG
ncbi:MAG: S41 family peptidase [Deltaproteobacteria bacterium]